MCVFRICYGDITAFSGQDDTCVCGISSDSQSGLDSPERKQSCSIGWDCFDHSTCEDIYRVRIIIYRSGYHSRYPLCFHSKREIFVLEISTKSQIPFLAFSKFDPKGEGGIWSDNP